MFRRNLLPSSSNVYKSYNYEWLKMKDDVLSECRYRLIVKLSMEIEDCLGTYRNNDKIIPNFLRNDYNVINNWISNIYDCSIILFSV